MVDMFYENLRFFNNIKPKNPPESFTVLAALNEVKSGKLLALSTGTQACLKVYSDDIEDGHAESLLKRAYKRHLIDYIQCVLNDEKLSLSKSEVMIKEKCNNDLVLSISKFPCGIVNRYEGSEPIDERGNKIKRKPGRGLVKDGKTIYVSRESCANKLKKWHKEGLQGSKLKQLFGIKSSLRKIVVGDCETEAGFDYPFFAKKLEDFINEESNPLSDFLTVEVVDRSVRCDEFVFDSKKQPQPVAMVWWAMSQNNNCNASSSPSNCQGGFELVVDGRKKGLTTSQSKSTCRNFRLKIADQLLKEDLHEIEQLYNNLKSNSS